MVCHTLACRSVNHECISHTHFHQYKANGHVITVKFIDKVTENFKIRHR